MLGQQYGQSTALGQVPEPTGMGDVLNLTLQQLDTVISSAESISDRLFGTNPKEVASGHPPTQPNLSQQASLILDRVQELSRILQRIHGSL